MERTLADYLAHAPVFIRKLDGEIVYWTQGAQELYGYTPSEANGRVSHSLLHTQFPEPLEDIDARLLGEGEWRGRLRHVARDGLIVWTESLWRLRRDGPGGMVVEQNTDVSERVALERHRDALTLELDHRVKNTLAVVQGLARMTFRDNGGRFEEFEQRLIALSEAHNLLTRRHWEHAYLKELIEDVARMLRVEGRLRLDGPEALLSPNAAVSYALAFHELATNALRHGALSRPEGRVDIRWTISDAAAPTISLVWRESGGPPPTPPHGEGFGARLIRGVVSRELGAEVQIRYEADGLVCVFDGPVQKRPALD